MTTAAVRFAPHSTSAPSKSVQSKSVQSRSARTESAQPKSAQPEALRAAAVYRRRRLVVLAVALGMVVAVCFAYGRIASAGAAPSGTTAAGASPVYVVHQGDTLWSIAEQLAPGRDPRPVVAALKRAAGGTDLYPGQHVLLPPGLGS